MIPRDEAYPECLRHQEIYDVDLSQVLSVVEELKKSPKIKIGVFGINRLQNDLVEISYLLDEQYQGKGYASEAINGLEKFCYEQWGTNVFVAEIHTENAKSISFITKMGYKKTRTCGCFEFFEKRI